jgi:hypothetical protein
MTAPTVTSDTIIVNFAYVSSSNELFSQTGNNLDSEFTAVLAPDPDITIDKAGPVHVKRVEKFAYTLTITNIGWVTPSTSRFTRCPSMLSSR